MTLFDKIKQTDYPHELITSIPPIDSLRNSAMANGNFTARLGSSDNPGLFPIREFSTRCL